MTIQWRVCCIWYNVLHTNSSGEFELKIYSGMNQHIHLQADTALFRIESKHPIYAFSFCASFHVRCFFLLRWYNFKQQGKRQIREIRKDTRSHIKFHENWNTNIRKHVQALHVSQLNMLRFRALGIHKLSSENKKNGHRTTPKVHRMGRQPLKNK